MGVLPPRAVAARMRSATLYTGVVSVLVYSLLRVLIVVACGAGLYLLGLRGALLFLGAVIVGALVSYLVLSGPRLRAAQSLKDVAERHPRMSRPDVDALAEDIDEDPAEVADDAGKRAVSAESEHHGDGEAGR